MAAAFSPPPLPRVFEEAYRDGRLSISALPCEEACVRVVADVAYTPPPPGGPYQASAEASSTRRTSLSKTGEVPKTPLERMRDKREARKGSQGTGAGGGRGGKRAFQPEEKAPTPEELKAALAVKKTTQIGEFAECMSNTRVTSAALSAPSYLHKPTHWFM